MCFLGHVDAGKSLNSKWITSNVNYVVSNGLNISGTLGRPGWIYSNFKVGPNDSVGFFGIFSGYNNIGTEGSQSFAGTFFQFSGDSGYGQEQFQGGVGATATHFSSMNTNYLLQILNSTTTSYTVGPTSLGKVTETGSSFPYNVTPFITNGANIISTFAMKSIFVAATSVNGVMPSVTFGSLS